MKIKSGITSKGSDARKVIQYWPFLEDHHPSGSFTRDAVSDEVLI